MALTGQVGLAVVFSSARTWEQRHGVSPGPAHRPGHQASLIPSGPCLVLSD